MMDGAVRTIIRHEYEFKIVPTRFTVPAERASLRPAVANRVNLAEAATLPPNSQTAVAVVAEVDGTVIIEPATQLLASRGVSISNGVHRVKKFRPFKVLMANFTTRGVDLPKNSKVGQVIIGETIALATDIPLDEVLGATLEEMLHRHSSMWNGQLAQINNTIHRIELVPGARPVRQSPYRQGPRGREFEDR